MNAIIRLFKAVPIVERKKSRGRHTAILKETVKNGFVFTPDVLANYSETELEHLCKVVSEEVGLSGEKMNSSFHKSWKKIREADIEQLVLEQIVHYITTYGFENWGIFDHSTVYIPDEELKIPKIKLDKISLVVIKGYTKLELKEKLVALLSTGIALKEETKQDVLDVVTFVEFSDAEVFNIKNKEVCIALYDYLNIVPEEPVEFLRYLIYKATNATLLIKDEATIASIKTKDNLSALGLLTRYQKQHGLERLAEIFYRFKPLFLAFRTNQRLKTIVNRIRKLAVKHHKPMPEDFLNSVTAHLKQDKKFDNDRLVRALGKVNIFRKIRLAYALKYRTEDVGSIMYRIRNGKSFSTKFSFPKKAIAVGALDTVLGSIVQDIRVNVSGKKIFVPKNVHYALPTTEKQFTGDLPSGSYISVPKDIVVGVHWFNVDGKRIDLDLSLIRFDGGKLGWDGAYRTGDRDILFSGDMTDAPKPNGAAELFYVEKQKEASYIMMVNSFNHGRRGWDEEDSPDEAPFTIVVASEKPRESVRHHMVDPNNVVCRVKSKIAGKQKSLGLLVTSPTGNRFYFAETNIGNSITSYGSAPYIQDARKYMLHLYTDTISLVDLLVRAGAVMVDDPKDAEIDLSFEKLEKDTIIKLLTQ